MHFLICLQKVEMSEKIKVELTQMLLVDTEISSVCNQVLNFSVLSNHFQYL